MNRTQVTKPILYRSCNDPVIDAINYINAIQKQKNKEILKLKILAINNLNIVQHNSSNEQEQRDRNK